MIAEIEYKLESVKHNDKELIYQLKKYSISPYVKKIWGWNESYQINDFNNSFLPINFKKIMVDEKLIGFIELLVNESNINITEIHIVPEYQNLGIGTNIINQIINEGRKSSKTISLGCFKENNGAAKLYKRLGFKIVKETETHLCFEIV